MARKSVGLVPSCLMQFKALQQSLIINCKFQLAVLGFRESEGYNVVQPPQQFASIGSSLEA